MVNMTDVSGNSDLHGGTIHNFYTGIHLIYNGFKWSSDTRYICMIKLNWFPRNFVQYTIAEILGAMHPSF